VKYVSFRRAARRSFDGLPVDGSLLLWVLAVGGEKTALAPGGSRSDNRRADSGEEQGDEHVIETHVAQSHPGENPGYQERDDCSDEAGNGTGRVREIGWRLREGLMLPKSDDCGEGCRERYRDHEQGGAEERCCEPRPGGTSGAPCSTCCRGRKRVSDTEHRQPTTDPDQSEHDDSEFHLRHRIGSAEDIADAGPGLYLALLASLVSALWLGALSLSGLLLTTLWLGLLWIATLGLASLGVSASISTTGSTLPRGCLLLVGIVSPLCISAIVVRCV